MRKAKAIFQLLWQSRFLLQSFCERHDLRSLNTATKSISAAIGFEWQRNCSKEKPHKH